jgi:hypothetical protein
VRLEELGKLIKLIQLIGPRILDLADCITVPQSLRYKKTFRLLKLLLTPYSLIGPCNNVQIYRTTPFLSLTGRQWVAETYVLFQKVAESDG